ncbi:SH3 and multiple ankyrin repeat domains protein 2 [Madurella fahalii]|uniref:SH3 and multiple ankyrin repeat domains protein 2 n=1 Tax=Madurella fahalii TaxID=1157608 RepID=A0ABQ0G3T9_9PEZI
MITTNSLPRPTGSVLEGNWPLLSAEIEKSHCDSFTDYALAMWPLLCKHLGKNARSRPPVDRRLGCIFLPTGGNHFMFHAWVDWIRDIHAVRTTFPVYSGFARPTDIICGLRGEQGPFFLACLLGLEDMVAAMVKEYPHLITKSQGGMDGLYLAICSTDEATVSILLEAGLSPNGSETHNKFVHAAIVGMEDTIRRMVDEFGAEINQHDENGETALASSLWRHDRIAEYLLSRGASSTAGGTDILVKAIRRRFTFNDETTIVDRLILGASPERLGMALKAALDREVADAKIVEKLLDAGAQTVFPGKKRTQSALGMAITLGHGKSVDVLQSKGLRPHPDELLYAWERDWADEVWHLLNAKMPLSPGVLRWYLARATQRVSSAEQEDDEILMRKWTNVVGLLSDLLGNEAEGPEEEHVYQPRDDDGDWDESDSEGSWYGAVDEYDS